MLVLELEWWYLVTIFEAPLGGNDSNVPEFLQESSRHVHPGETFEELKNNTRSANL